MTGSLWHFKFAVMIINYLFPKQNLFVPGCTSNYFDRIGHPVTRQYANCLYIRPFVGWQIVLSGYRLYYSPITITVNFT